MIWTSRRLLDLAMSPIALYPYIRYRGYMDNESVIVALGALAQATRLDAFRLLVRHEPEGLPAGEVAKALDVPQNTMRSEEHTSELQSLMRISYAVFCLQKK